MAGRQAGRQANKIISKMRTHSYRRGGRVARSSILDLDATGAVNDEKPAKPSRHSARSLISQEGEFVDPTANRSHTGGSPSRTHGLSPSRTRRSFSRTRPCLQNAMRSKRPTRARSAAALLQHSISRCSVRIANGRRQTADCKLLPRNELAPSDATLQQRRNAHVRRRRGQCGRRFARCGRCSFRE